MKISYSIVMISACLCCFAQSSRQPSVRIVQFLHTDDTNVAGYVLPQIEIQGAVAGFFHEVQVNTNGLCSTNWQDYSRFYVIDEMTNSIVTYLFIPKDLDAFIRVRYDLEDTNEFDLRPGSSTGLFERQHSSPAPSPVPRSTPSSARK